MARAVHVEPLNRGLWTARDPAFLPEGALVKARNLRYKPGDVAVYQSEGRIAEDNTVIYDPYGFVNLVWDPGSEAESGKPELYQVLYVDTQNQPLLVTREVLRAQGLGGARAYKGLHKDYTQYVNQGHWEAVAMVDRANGDLANWFVLSPGAVRPQRNLVMVRGTSPTELRRGTAFESNNNAETPVLWYSAGNYGAPVGDTYLKFNGGVHDAADRLLQHPNDRLYFGMIDPFTAIQFGQFWASPEVSAGEATWQYWDANAGAFVTMSVAAGTQLGTNTFQHPGTVRWTQPGAWGAATFETVTGRAAPAGSQWGDLEFYWVQVFIAAPPYPGNPWVGLLSAPIGFSTIPTPKQPAQRFIPHGLPKAADATVSSVVAAGGSVLEVGKRYEYWWVWADEYNSHEGISDDDQRTSVEVTASANRKVTLTITWGLTAIPPGATHVHIYRGEGTDGVDGHLGLSYPTGKRVYSLEVDDIIGETAHVFTDSGDSMSETYGGVQALSTLSQAFPQASLVDPATGALLAVPRNGAPPSASTGDVFQESLLLNDLSDPRKIRFSYSGQPHAFPELFYVNLETRDSDRVVAIRSVGNVCGIVALGSTWRLNWLPRETDVDFGRGEMLSPVMGYGAADSSAVCTFSPPGGQMELAIAGTTGLYRTNLYEWAEMVPQFDWSVLGTGQRILVNNPLQYRLEVYVPEHNEVWYVHYHPTLVEGGLFPITGPVERPGGVAEAAYMQTSPTSGAVMSSTRAHLHFEGYGNVDEATGERLAAEMHTREMWLAGMGDEFKINRLLVHSKESWITNPLIMVASSGANKPAGIKVLRTGPRRLELPWSLGKAEFVQLQLTGRVDQDFGLAITAVGVDAESLGKREVR